MSLKTFCTVTSAIFAVVALIHLARIILVWQMTIGGWTVPIWVSWIGFVVASGLAYLGLKYATQKRIA
jgi:hypothetical protein